MTSKPFARSLRSVAADSFRGNFLWLGTAMVLFAGWSAWLFLSKVTVYEVSETARLEVRRAVHPIGTPGSGRVVKSNLELGREVQSGEVLVELDAEFERRRLDEEEARRSALAPQLLAVRAEMAALEQAAHLDRSALFAALARARADLRAADVNARHAEDVARRVELMSAQGAATEIEERRTAADANARRASAQALQHELRRQMLEQRTRESERQARLEKLRRDEAVIEGQLATEAAAVAVLKEQIDRRLIRASATGRLADVAPLERGAVVREGDRLATVIPKGKLVVMAAFSPPSALGRIRPGQPAELRLKGFPWTQYGTVSAHVTSVGKEPHDGQVQVELAPEIQPELRVPLEHGLPGTVEIAVEQISPVRLVLRVIGQRMAQPPGSALGLDVSSSTEPSGDL